MSVFKQSQKIRERWSILAEANFDLDDEVVFKSEESTKGSDSNIAVDKIDKILDWLQDHGVKEGCPGDIQEDNEEKCKQRVLLKQ